MEVQRFDVLAVLVVLYELHEAQLVVFIHEVDDLVQQLFAVAASDEIVGVGGRGADKDIDKRGGFWYSTKVPCANDTRWCGAMAAQLICNQWVAGSTPVTSSKKSYDTPLKSGVCRGAFAFMSPTASPPFRKIMPPGGAWVLKSAHHAIIIGSAKQRTSK